MRPWISVTLVSVLAALMMGCEGDWTSGGGVESWNSSYNWVNFSGVYKGIGGGLLVTDYSATPGTSGVTNSATQSFVANGQTEQTVTCSKKPVVRGSATITISGGYAFTDEDGDGVLSGSSGTSGEINYQTGVITLRFFDIPPNSGAAGSVTYSYTVAGTAGTGSAGSGSTGIKIYSFTVFQEGNIMSITDNNGSVYEGNFGSITSSMGTTTPTAGDTVVGQFECNGVSAAGFSVSIVGTLQGVVTGTGNVLGDRQMFGTWIEEGGRTGDVNGEASPISISVTTTTTGTDTTTN
ncbi:MAG TPA: hypothetical protein PLE77_12975 [Kiritimatiellia bacterium]|nr:hypothetical protein [Kiritimatiellia bacterium]